MSELGEWKIRDKDIGKYYFQQFSSLLSVVPLRSFRIFIFSDCESPACAFVSIFDSLRSTIIYCYIQGSDAFPSHLPASLV